MAKDSKKPKKAPSLKSLKKKLTKVQEELKQLKTRNILLERAKPPTIKEITHAVGFMSMAYIIKQGVFDPFKKLFSLDIFKIGDIGGLVEGIPTSVELTASALGIPTIFTGPGLLKEITKLQIEFALLPAKIQDRLTKDVISAIGITKDLNEKAKVAVDEEVQKAVEQRLRDVTAGIAGATLGGETAQEIRERNLQQVDNMTESQIISVLSAASFRAQLEGWAFGFAGAWAVGKFLSETTITELVDALDTFTPLT